MEQPDRSWMWQRFDGHGRLRQEFEENLVLFLQFAAANSTAGRRATSFRCPCTRCLNRYYEGAATVRGHIYRHGFMENYTLWTFHGEREHGAAAPSAATASGNSLCAQMVIDGMGAQAFDYPDDIVPVQNGPPEFDPDSFYSLLEDADAPLHDGGTKHSVLSAMSQLLTHKTEGQVSNTTFDRILNTVGDMLPANHKLPKNMYECNKKMKKLGLEYVKIDACINNCMLYYRGNMHRTNCTVCGQPRYRVPPSGRKRGIAFRVLRYLPLIPRLRRLYLSTKTAPHMTWHHLNQKHDGTMSHPCDSKSWKHFSDTHPSFASEPRNVRLGLCTDGFTPFNHYGAPYSCWPVILTVYNLPPWMCMKEPYMFLNMVIPGPSHPGKDIDVFLRPLVDELQSLWVDGVSAFDASVKEKFTLRAALMWTVSDLPAYAMLSGWGTAGRLACPYCMEETDAFQLQYGRKTSHFDCHRKFLPDDHEYRGDVNGFRSGHSVTKSAPPELCGYAILERLSDIGSVTYGKTKEGKKPPDGYGVTHNWRKKSIFWELPYWRTLLIRHNLDVMHVEKNVFENVFNTVMDVTGKTKDNNKAHTDQAAICNRTQYALRTGGGTTEKPIAPYALNKEKRKAVYRWLKEVKLPDGYGSNISRCANVDDAKITGLKSHDCHVLLQVLLPIALRYTLDDHIWEPLCELSFFFRDLYCRTLNAECVKVLKVKIVETVCKLEKISPRFLRYKRASARASTPRGGAGGTGPVSVSVDVPI